MQMSALALGLLRVTSVYNITLYLPVLCEFDVYDNEYMPMPLLIVFQAYRYYIKHTILLCYTSGNL